MYAPGQLEGKGNIRWGKTQNWQKGLFLWCLVGKLIVQGANAYLAYIMNTPEPRNEVSQVPIIREFMDVFHEELLGMPSIELEPGTTPISCTPYKMVPIELKKLKEQL